MLSGSTGVSGGLFVRGQLPQRPAARRSSSALALLLLFSTLAAACSSAPILKKLEPPTGQPHDVIFVEGDGREFAQIIWDVGQLGEKPIPGAYLGAFMFSVPPDAVPGKTYEVALENSAGRSATVKFNVPATPGPLDEPRPPGPTVAFPPPRIDAVTLVGTSFDPSGMKVDSMLYVQGANIDVGATVWVQDSITAPPVEVATASHRALRNEWYGVSADQLGYPIYHYSSTIVSAGVRDAGQKVWLIVKNLEGARSQPFEYTLPKGADSLDSDGDGLLDKWEIDGYHADGDGIVDIDLPKLGADPYRRDLFLELDIMDGLLYPPHRGEEEAPDTTVFDALKRMFESAPILNYGGAPGIHLELDASEKPCLPNPPGPDVCSFDKTSFSYGTALISPPSSSAIATGTATFAQLKAHSFKNELRGKVYHYAIWGIQRFPDYDAGISDYGDDFLITIDKRNPFHQSRRSQIEALAHEFGHNLGQFHGGADHQPALSANYLSVMSYTWDLRTGWPDDERRKQRATCLPFYYAEKDAKEANGVPPMNVNTIVDYSEGMAKALTKPPASTAPTVTTFCGLTVDWMTVSPATTMEDFANWRALVFKGPVDDGWLKP